MRHLCGAIVIFIIFFKEREASDPNSEKWNWNKAKLRIPKEANSRGKQSRIDIVGTPKRTNSKDSYEQRRTPAMDFGTQQDLENHQARQGAPPAMDLLSQFRAQHPESRPEAPGKSHRKKYIPVESNPLYPADLGIAPPNQLLINGEILSESQMYQMAFQRHGKYAPLHPKPPMFPSNFKPSGSNYGTAGGGTSGASGHPNTQPEPYFETEADREAYLMSGQHQGSYSPYHPDPRYFDSGSEHSGSGSHY